MVRFAGIAILLFACQADAQELTWPSPGETVTVTLKDARTLTGVVTSDTTPRSLALARTSRGLTLESNIPRAKIEKLAKLPPLELTESETPPLPPEVVEVKTAPARPPRVPMAKVKSVTVRARLANWDNDPEPDGLLVEVSPLDAMGNFVPAACSIDLELYGERHQQSGHSYDYREPFTLLDRTAKILRAADAGSESYVVRFPFRRFHPERNLEISESGLMQARLSVPGQGVFKASDDWTMLRDSSRTRDNLQQLTGSRYLPAESR